MRRPIGIKDIFSIPRRYDTSKYSSVIFPYKIGNVKYLLYAESFYNYNWTIGNIMVVRAYNK